jgi:hypothetical protein
MRKGMSIDALAERTANIWRQGLEEQGQSDERIRRLRETVDMAIYIGWLDVAGRAHGTQVRGGSIGSNVGWMQREAADVQRAESRCCVG